MICVEGVWDMFGRFGGDFWGRLGGMIGTWLEYAGEYVGMFLNIFWNIFLEVRRIDKSSRIQTKLISCICSYRLCHFPTISYVSFVGGLYSLMKPFKGPYTALCSPLKSPI